MSEKRSTIFGYDYIILIPVILLVGLGLMVVYCASSPLAEHRFGDSYYYLKRQALFCLLGFGLMIIARNITCNLYSKFVYPLILISFCLLFLTLVPGFGHKTGGACRGFRLWEGVIFQPSGVAKISLAIYTAYFMSKHRSYMGQFTKGVLSLILITGILVIPIVLQPDIWTAVIFCIWILTLLFLAGVKFHKLLSIMVFGSVVFLMILHPYDYKVHRWLASLNPWDDPQVLHSFFNFGLCGFFGTGLGDSQLPLFHLPDLHTEFILLAVAKELGLLGVAVIVLLFGLLIIRGIKVALNTRDIYSKYLAIGLICFIGLQAVFNMGGVMGLLPARGLTLPFISYGGSSLVFNLFSIGILLNISSRR